MAKRFKSVKELVTVYCDPDLADEITKRLEETQGIKEELVAQVLARQKAEEENERLRWNLARINPYDDDSGMSDSIFVGLVEIEYTNYKGERATRRIRPLYIVWGKNDWHPEEQWLLQARDIDKDAVRTFALKNIHSWKPLEMTREAV